MVMRKSVSHRLHAICAGILLASSAAAQTSAPSSRAQINRSLDSAAAGFTAVRAARIAAIRTRGEAEARPGVSRFSTSRSIMSSPAIAACSKHLCRLARRKTFFPECFFATTFPTSRIFSDSA